MVTCELCGRQFRRINNFHLQSEHGISQGEYLRRFPDAEVISDSLGYQISKTSKEAWRNPNRAPYSDEHRGALSEALKIAWGSLTKEEYESWCDGISEAHLGAVQDEDLVWKRTRSGFTHSEETKRRIGQGIAAAWDRLSFEERLLRGVKMGLVLVGVDRGGIRGLYGPGWDVLRDEIFERDSDTCQKCGRTSFTKGNPETCHHIDYDTYNMRESNLITLCGFCNKSVNSDREYWEAFFYGKIKEIYQEVEL